MVFRVAYFCSGVAHEIGLLNYHFLEIGSIPEQGKGEVEETEGALSPHPESPAEEILEYQKVHEFLYLNLSFSWSILKTDSAIERLRCWLLVDGQLR